MLYAGHFSLLFLRFQVRPPCPVARPRYHRRCPVFYWDYHWLSVSDLLLSPAVLDLKPTTEPLLTPEEADDILSVVAMQREARDVARVGQPHHQPSSPLSAPPAYFSSSGGQLDGIAGEDGGATRREAEALALLLGDEMKLSEGCDERVVTTGEMDANGDKHGSTNGRQEAVRCSMHSRSMGIGVRGEDLRPAQECEGGAERPADISKCHGEVMKAAGLKKGARSLQQAAEPVMIRLAARYLARETVRGKIPDPVGNFHVRVRVQGLRRHDVNFFLEQRTAFREQFLDLVPLDLSNHRLD